MVNKCLIAVFVVLCLAWQTYATANCTASGAGRHPDPVDNTCRNYTLCVFVANNNSFVAYDYSCPTTSLFNPNSAQCTAPANYACPATTTTTTTPSPNTNTNQCTADGFIADPTSTDCTSYIQCVNINGVFSQTTLTCPTGTFYNPNTTNCETTYTCPATQAFSCTGAGRFANTADTTCQTYYLCVQQTNGTYANYQYTCPSTSVFNPNSRLCTANYVCTN